MTAEFGCHSLSMSVPIDALSPELVTVPLPQRSGRRRWQSRSVWTHRLRLRFEQPRLGMSCCFPLHEAKQIALRTMARPLPLPENAGE